MRGDYHAHWIIRVASRHHSVSSSTATQMKRQQSLEILGVREPGGASQRADNVLPILLVAGALDVF